MTERTDTERPEAWAVVDAENVFRGDEIYTHEADADEALRMANLHAYKMAPWRKVPLYEHPAALPSSGEVTEAMVEAAMEYELNTYPSDKRPMFGPEVAKVVREFYHGILTAALRARSGGGAP